MRVFATATGSSQQAAAAGSGSREQPAGSSRQQYAGGMQQAAVAASSSRQLRQAAVGRLRADTSSQAGSIRQQQEALPGRWQRHAAAAGSSSHR